MSSARRRSPRVGRFGPRSLTARLLILLLVPMLGLQVLAYRELQRQNEAVASARAVEDAIRQMHDELLTQPGAIARSAVRDSASTSGLQHISAQVDELGALVDAATAEIAALSDIGIADGSPQDVVAPLTALIGAASDYDAAALRLHESLPAAWRTRLDTLVESDASTELTAARTALIEQVIDSPQRTRAVATMLTASLARLQALDAFAGDLLSDRAAAVNNVRERAQNSRTAVIVVMVTAVVVGLIILALVVRSILRPLRRLTRQAYRVSGGELDGDAAQPTGPTDVRVVERTFNEMVATLQTYDAQMRHLATGDTQVDTDLPGRLGDTVRQSVSHLAALTQRLHESEAAANAQARTDALTGLGNRMLVLEQLAEMALAARNTGRRSAVIYLDLDGFKSVNDTDGHAEGDRVLAEIGARLRNACPQHVLARLGGDEFVVLVRDEDNLEHLTELASFLIRVVAEPCTGSAGRRYTLSASAGLTIVDGSREPLTSIAQADSAVYHAKSRGRGRVEVFDEHLAHEMEERAEWALTMREGLERGEFTLKLQPIIELPSMQPIGAEALLRWQRPGHGEILPSEFIPVAERTDVIVDIDRWVLEQAVGVLRDWRIEESTAGMRLAVNISGRHIVDGALHELLDELCTRALVDPSLLDLEITETHLVADVARAESVVDILREQGVKVAIDDFGTGYSSMSYLHQLTVDTLKIDRVFVAGARYDPLDRSIVELLLRLGDSLGLKVVAEGVEDAPTLELLSDLGCHLAQGFHIARPMPIAEATAWLRERVVPMVDASVTPGAD